MSQSNLSIDTPPLVYIAGLGGAIGSTLALGLALAEEHPEMIKFGSVTESEQFKDINLNFSLPNSSQIGGWDKGESDVYSALIKNGLYPRERVDLARTKTKEIEIRHAYTIDQNIEYWIRKEADTIQQHAAQAGAQQVVLINLCPTESYHKQRDTGNINWEDLKEVDPLKDEVSASRIYFRLAIEAGAHFINFTPNIAEIPILKELALNRDLIYCGRDGKTGQTFLKTTIAPALHDRNLQVDGWYSVNILGNNDGLTLAKSENAKTKIDTKLESLEAILGYTPGHDKTYGHQVHIHYYPPRGDSKEAWDSIDLTGFLGYPIQIKINLQGRDSILAAPLIIDLIRIVAHAASRGHRGNLEEVGYFFKSPIVSQDSLPKHSTYLQMNELLDFLKTS